MVAGEAIGNPVAANDANRDTLAYTLGGTDAASFDIDSATGQLMTLLALDYETKASYEVMVTATDPEGASDMITVTITVINADDEGMVTLSPMQPVVDTEITASLTDDDGEVSGVTWQWASSPDRMAPWDRHQRSHGRRLHPGGRRQRQLSAGHGVLHRRTRLRQDRGWPRRTVRCRRIAPLSSTRQRPERSVAENTAVGGNVGAPVVATDADTGDTVAYSLSGTDMASFDIDSTGQITVGAGTMLDAEGTQTTYMVTVTASDGVASDTIDVTIAVENAPLAGMGDTYDANNNEMIERSEAIAAVRAYFREEITKEQAIQVIGLYFASAGN